MSDILRKLQKAYVDNPMNASYLLPELIKEIEQGNIIEKTCDANTLNPCQTCGLKKALNCIKHDSVCNTKKKYEEYRISATYSFGYQISGSKVKK